jgi:hypothetical protein
LEQEKLAGQLNQLQQQKETLSKIEITFQPKIQFGSLIIASNGIYFMSIGLGKIEVNNLTIFCISTSSPVGQLFLNKKAGKTIQFNGDEILIKELN